MGASLLTVDLGNSVAKLRAWRVDSTGALHCTARLELEDPAANRSILEAFFAANPALELAAMSSVAAEETTARCRESLGASTRARWLDTLDSGLANRTREPERVGRDRLFAARGALECLRKSAIVIDVGTALTVDALLVLDPPSSDADWPLGAFLGGAIAPGATLLARALASGAARLFEVTPLPDPPALGRDSGEAMRAGIGVGLRGAARELAIEVAREAGLVDPPIALTGGGRAFVARAFGSRQVFESADLVHLGLCAALLQAGGCPRPGAFGAR